MALSPIEITDLRPIRDLVYESLRSAIMKGHLEAGERLVESEIAERLQVSRTPVREALRMLEKDGIATSVPRRGTVVVGLKLEDAIEIYSILSVLEGLVAKLAAEHITQADLQLLQQLKAKKPPLGDFLEYARIFAEFNDILNRASRSTRLMQLMETYASQLSCLRYVSLDTPERQSAAWDEHLTIIEAIEKRDGLLAEERAKQHVQNAMEACAAWGKHLLKGTAGGAKITN
ncbi:MAG: HTH-type transcriptional repressor RspR [Firmicutes bacterium]|nr:HTH-type transcriptional repressor RspR [Bacillota bacterium]